MASQNDETASKASCWLADVTHTGEWRGKACDAMPASLGWLPPWLGPVCLAVITAAKGNLLQQQRRKNQRFDAIRH